MRPAISPAATVLDLAMNERELMDCVSGLVLALKGDFYHTFNSLHSRKGYPDLHIVLGTRELYVETKSQKGRVEDAQWYWLEMMAGCGHETAVWRPSDWRRGLVDAVLRDGRRVSHREEPSYAAWARKHAVVGAL